MKLFGLASGIAQLVGNAGADVLQLFGGFYFVGCAQCFVKRFAQIYLAHIDRRAITIFAKVLYVHHAQRDVLQRHLVSAAVFGQISLPTDHAFYLKTLGTLAHGYGAQFDAGAAVVKAALVDLDAFVVGRVIYLDTRRDFLACFFVGNHDFAGKQLGHASGVMLDNKFFQLNRKR